MAYQIKRLIPTDIEQAKQLFTWYKVDDGKIPVLPTDDYLHNLLARPDFYVVIALDREKVIGGITAYELSMYKESTTELFVYEVGVQAEYRRQGIATQIFELTKQLARANGVGEMFVDAEADNDTAIQFYTAIGGKPLAAVEFTYFLDDLDTSTQILPTK